jgi:hypothetical protein
MATFYGSICGSCGYRFSSSSPHEFWRDRNGVLRDYGHPRASSPDAERAGVHGIYSRMWCLNCETNVDVVTREFEHPVARHGLWRLLLTGGAPEKRVSVVCPICSEDIGLVVGTQPFGEEFPCPKCGGTVRCECIGMT